MKRMFGTLACCLAASGVLGAPTDYVHLPDVDFGAREIDVKFGAAKSGTGQARAASIGYGWTPASRWLTELNAHWRQEPDAGTQLRAFEWENKFQLTETGRYPFEAGLLLELEVPRESDEAREVILGALLQRVIGRTQLNANVLLERAFGGEEDEAGDDEAVELGYQWQVKYGWREAFGFGAQGFGALGAWDDLAPAAAQEHSAGPAIFGEMELGGGEYELEYNAALLYAAGGDAPDYTFRLQVEFEF